MGMTCNFAVCRVDRLGQFRLMGSFDGSVCQLVPKLASMKACSIGGKKKLAEGLQQALTGKRVV